MKLWKMAFPSKDTDSLPFPAERTFSADVAERTGNRETANIGVELTNSNNELTDTDNEPGLCDLELSDVDDELTDTDDEFVDGDNNGQLYEHFRLTADKGQQLLRIDKFLFARLPGKSRNRIQKAAEAGFVHVNGKPVKSSYRVKPLDVVTLLLDRPRYEAAIEPEDIPLNIVYEDSELMVVNKPAGLVVHPGHGNYTGTLVNAVAWHMRDNPAYDPNNPAVGLVHRIDKDTSGLLAIAKTPEAKTGLGLQFFNKTTRRSYEALVWGDFAEDDGMVIGNIARNVRDRLQMSVFPADSGVGKSAITHFRVIERFGYTTLLECRLETGRTHQIRAHMRHAGHPVFGDIRYGGGEILRGKPTNSYRQFVTNCFKLCPRQALHARTLGFTHPSSGKAMDFEVPPPDDLQELIGKWRKFASSAIERQ